MEKKVLEFYEAPACKVVELKVMSAILVGSTGSNPETNPFHDNTEDPEEV